jgi:hypothetical protein
VSEPAAVVTDDAVREEEYEARFEAAPAVLVILCLQVVITLSARAGVWNLWSLPWWVMWFGLVPEAALLLTLAFDRPRHRLEQFGHRATATIALFGVISVANALLLAALITSLVSGEELSGGLLLFKGLIVWTMNALTFGLWFWSIDRGGPAERREPNPPPPDFLFPQVSDPSLAEPGWHPRLLDYMYVSLTNSIAFSPTDTLPLTHLAKSLMLAESAVSAVTVLLVIARAVNIFK